MTTFLKGDSSAEISLTLAEGFDYSGKTLCVEYQGVCRRFPDAAAGGTVAFSYTAKETASMSLGAYPVRVWLEGADGSVTTVRRSAVKFRVTDALADVRSGEPMYLDVRGGLYGLEGLPARWTETDLRAKINEIIARLGGAVAALLLAFSASGASITLQTAPKGEIYNDEQIVTNATFDASGLATPQDIATATNATLQAAKEYADGAISAAGAVTPEAVTNIVNDIAPTPGDYENVSNKAVNAVQEVVINDVTNNAFKIAVKGIPTSTWYTNATTNDAARVKIGTLTVFQGKGTDIKVAGADEYIEWPVTGNQPANYDLYAPGETDPTVPAWAKSENPPVMSLEPATNYTDTAVSAAETRLNETNAATRAIVMTWEDFIGGSNVVFSITNYLSGAYSTDCGKLKILELRDGAYRELYDSHTDITNHLAEFKANDMVPALSALSNSVETALADVPDKAWGRYTSAGEENEMTNAVWISHPETVFGGGTEWKRVAVGEGSVCFLTTSGNQVYTAGEEGKFYFSDWGYTNKFGFATTASFTIGIDPDSIQVDSSQIVAIGFDVTMTGVPVIWYAPAIEGAPVWEQLNNPDGSPVAGASHVVSFDTQTTPGWIYAFVNCANEDRGFFRAAIEQEGGASLFSTMPIDPQGGILCTNGINKVGIDWNNGQPRLVPWRN